MDTMKLLVLLSLICCVQSHWEEFKPTVYSKGEINVRLFPAGTIDLEDKSHCFSSTCENDQNIHFYLEQLFQEPINTDICEYANQLRTSEKVKETPIVSFNEDGQLEFSIPSLLRLIYTSETCHFDILKALQPLEFYGEKRALPEIHISVIESRRHINLDDELFSCKNHCSSGVYRLNLVIPDWCDSTCARGENCIAGYELPSNIEKKELDFAITRFQVKKFLTWWSFYMSSIEQEIGLLQQHEDDVQVPWDKVISVHSELNQCLYGRNGDTQFTLRQALKNIEQKLTLNGCQ